MLSLPVNEESVTIAVSALHTHWLRWPMVFCNRKSFLPWCLGVGLQYAFDISKRLFSFFCPWPVTCYAKSRHDTSPLFWPFENEQLFMLWHPPSSINSFHLVIFWNVSSIVYAIAMVCFDSVCAFCFKLKNQLHAPRIKKQSVIIHCASETTIKCKDNSGRAMHPVLCSP